MRILLLGYGKMGKAIEAEAIGRGHHIVAKIDQHNLADLNGLSAAEVDVAIEFTHPGSFAGNLDRMLEKGIPMVSGTTGWHTELEAVKNRVETAKGSFLYSSNFSVGVNLLFELNRKLAQLMN
ncbi:MAG: 4-hydroxy-tetrahydrodipicolinate reductase, partial [Bacteroidia bacterium]|nr:4-hydroxy-tetrahydrodipicolinate reductase [Bacteroidia bacterium]